MLSYVSLVKIMRLNHQIMGYKALVILELPEATEEQKAIFNQALSKELWFRIENLNAAWKIAFNQNWSRAGAIEAIESDLKKAKHISGVPRVEYALQLDIQVLVIKSS